MITLQILGPGCAKCKALAANAEEAARALGIEFRTEKITDIRDIVKFGVSLTPALAVNGQVKVSGKVPTVDEIKPLLR